MTGLTLFSWLAAIAATLVAACGSKPKPVEPHVDVDASAPDAAPPEVPDAAPEAAPPPPKTIALCSVGGDPTATKQCLVWSGCAGGMVLTVRGKPYRKCSAPQADCEETEEKLVMASQRIPPGARSCAKTFYLAKEVDIGDQKWRVCPEDAEDKELNVLWKRIVTSCRQPAGDTP
jgi:hypothetical protein